MRLANEKIDLSFIIELAIKKKKKKSISSASFMHCYCWVNVFCSGLIGWVIGFAMDWFLGHEYFDNCSKKFFRA